MREVLLLILLLLCGNVLGFFHTPLKRLNKVLQGVDDGDLELSSKTIRSLTRKIEETQEQLQAVLKEREIEEANLKDMDSEFGEEIARVRKEFARMKERAVEESTEILAAAKAGAVKEVLPISDNYARAKTVFEPIESDGDKSIEQHYDSINDAFQKVLNEFGLERVESLGQPFDFNFMEAIMMQPSTEYAENVVMQEFQVGYKMGDKSVRPAMVIVSQGPGPS